jgi:CheY-like chemotaxis protein
MALMQDTDFAYDCILLDAQMPEMDGYELAYQLRAAHPDLPPMLMLSSGALRGDAQRCHEAGIAGFSQSQFRRKNCKRHWRTYSTVAPRSQCQAIPPPDPALASRAQPNLHILLVEDNPTNQKLALRLLEKWGHTTTLAHHGQEAIELLNTQSFDLILMDMQMPVMGGIDATKHIRNREAAQHLPRTPIIAMTAAAMQDDRDACLAAGMDDYLSKPIKVKELQEKLLALGRNH